MFLPSRHSNPEHSGHDRCEARQEHGFKVLERIIVRASMADALITALHSRGVGSMRSQMGLVPSESGVALFLAGKFRGVWVVSPPTLSWVLPAYLLPSYQTTSVDDAVEHTVALIPGSDWGELEAAPIRGT